jgi:hypothetical protein
MGNCSVQDTKGTVATFDRDSLSKAVWPERVVQYYRASSFALSLDSYNNSASSPLNQSKDNNTAPAVLADTPLPDGPEYDLLGLLERNYRVFRPPHRGRHVPGPLQGCPGWNYHRLDLWLHIAPRGTYPFRASPEEEVRPPYGYPFLEYEQWEPIDAAPVQEHVLIREVWEDEGEGEPWAVRLYRDTR